MMSGSVVYIVGEDGPAVPDVVKIGFSIQLGSRVASLQTSAHKKLKVFRAIDGDRSTEAWMHERFGRLRLHGEWFKFCEEMLSVTPPAVRIPSAAPPREQVAGVNRRRPDYNLLMGKKDNHGSYYDYSAGQWVDKPPVPNIVPIPNTVFTTPVVVTVRPGEGLIINGATLAFSDRTNVSVGGSIDILRTVVGQVEPESA
jgi:hypothetical protein